MGQGQVSDQCGVASKRDVLVSGFEPRSLNYNAVIRRDNNQQIEWLNHSKDNYQQRTHTHYNVPSHSTRSHEQVCNLFLIINQSNKQSIEQTIN